MKRITALLPCLALALGLAAQAPQQAPYDTDEVFMAISAEVEDLKVIPADHGPMVVKEPQRVQFAWGADVGAAIDMSGNDMSSFDVDAMFGIRWRWIKFLGVGVQAEMMVSNSARTYPIFLDFRTNFIDAPSLVFWNVRAGVALSYPMGNIRRTDAYAATGIGINLATGSNFSSHMILSYEFHSRKDITTSTETIAQPPLHAVAVKIGISF